MRYTYDNNGNTLTKTDSTGTTSYAWDFENRLTQATLPGSGGIVTFKYDPFGRRIYKSSSSGSSVFAYDGDNLIEETNSSGAVVARYSQTENIDEPLAMLRSGATSYYNADGLGSITSLTNSSGVAAETYTYDSFGKRTASAGAVTNPFQYTGREFDSEIGLYYNRARYYDPTVGRFIGEDPLGFGGGINFYRYVYNSPLGLTDPMGLSPADVQRIQIACKKCTQQLSDAGNRLAWNPGGLLNVLSGWANDAAYYFKKNIYSCYGQAQFTTTCLGNPSTPYDDKWRFDTQPIWLGSHRVTRSSSPNPNDPIVICDPWLNRTYTLPKPPSGPVGGGGAF